MAAYKAGSADIDPALDACLGLYDYYFTAYVTLGLAEAYSPEDEAFVSGWGENKPSDQLWAEYEDVYRNPQYYDSTDGDINWPENDGFLRGNPLTIRCSPILRSTAMEVITELLCLLWDIHIRIIHLHPVQSIRTTAYSLSESP